jgi:CubicO group peptidase (beta-lactamase class C family)
MRTLKLAVVPLMLLSVAIGRVVPLVAAETPAAAGSAAASTVPDTPAGRQLTAWLRAFNTGKLETWRAFVAEEYAAAALQERSAADRAIGLAMVYDDTRGLRVRRVERSTDREIAVMAQSPLTEAWVRVTLRVAAEAPHAITGVTLARVPRPADAGPRGKMSDTEIIKQLAAFVSKLVAAEMFSGSVLVARDGAPIFKHAYGLASKAWNAPNRIDTKFNLGSMNKMFTAVTIAQLVDQGKLSFTDPISKPWPDYPNKSIAERVTIHHLLTHTSGLGDYFNEKFMEASRDRFRTIQDYLPLFVNAPLVFEPGARWSYSNAGFMVLGGIIEKVAGQSYFETVRERVYKPAGMGNTDAYEMDRDVPNLAIGYTKMGLNGQPDPGPWRNNLFMHVIKGGPAGGGFSTVEDLLRFDVALRKHRLLSAATTDLVLAGKVKAPFGPDAKYAYGFIEERVNGKRITGHGGGFPGISAQLDMYLDQGYTVAVLCNYDRAAQIVSNKLREMITQE